MGSTTEPAPARENVSFRSGAEDCAAWLYRPRADSGLAPCVALGHGFGALKEGRLDAYAQRFRDVGFTALAFDYRHFGESGGEPRQLIDIRGQLDARRALGLTWLGLVDSARALVARPPRYMPTVGPPGSLAAMTGDNADTGYAAMYPEGFEWRNEVAARVMLRFALYSPGRDTSRVACPILFQVGPDDHITPPAPAIAAARTATRAELVTYPITHFEIYRGEPFERAVADQLEFLGRHLPP